MHVNAVKFVYLHRRLLIESVLSEVRSKYAGSAVGLGWLVLNPILILGFYATVYLVIFRIRPIGMDRFTYVAHILAGLLPFLTISESLNAGSQSLSANRDIFKNTVFPAELLIAKTVFAAHIQMLVGLAGLLLVLLFRNGLSATVLLLPAVVIAQYCFLVGVVWILSLLSLVLRDIQNLIGFLVMALMVASPIAYTPHMVPENLRALLYLNPVAHFIVSYQDIIVHGVFPKWYTLGFVFVGSFCVFSLGFAIFVRLKKVVANYA